jgi:hypothetical protein
VKGLNSAFRLFLGLANLHRLDLVRQLFLHALFLDSLPILRRLCPYLFDGRSILFDNRLSFLLDHSLAVCAKLLNPIACLFNGSLGVLPFQLLLLMPLFDTESCFVDRPNSALLVGNVFEHPVMLLAKELDSVFQGLDIELGLASGLCGRR